MHRHTGPINILAYWPIGIPSDDPGDLRDAGCLPVNRFSQPVDTENPVRIENAGFGSVREIIMVSTMTPFFIALLALVTSTFRTRAAQQAEIVALRHQIAVLQQNANSHRFSSRFVGRRPIRTAEGPAVYLVFVSLWQGCVLLPPASPPLLHRSLGGASQ